MKRKNMLFISHSTKDEVLVSNFVDLLYSIGFTETEMFCSSRSDIGVTLQKDIYKYLRNLLNDENVIPIFMLSGNYYDSPACLNEMGAVWMKQKKYFTFLLPEFNFCEIKGAINPNQRSVKLDINNKNLKGDLNSFKDIICKLFNKTISENKWEKQRDEFISKLKSTNLITINLKEHEGFCINNINYGGCNAIYNEISNKVVVTFDFSKTASEICSLVFFTGELDVSNKFNSNGQLRFSLKSKDHEIPLTVELNLKNRDTRLKIQTSTEWEDYSIPLKKFGSIKSEWTTLREIKFLVYRNEINKETIEIKNIELI